MVIIKRIFLRVKRSIFRPLDLIFFLSFINLGADVPILIITTAYNKPEYIELQYKSFKKFLKNEFKYVVFNDADNDNLKKQIENECNKLNIECYRVPQELHHSPLPDWVNIENCWPCGLGGIIAAYRHSQSVRYAFEKFNYYKEGIVCLIDGDCFLVSEFNAKKFLDDAAVTKLAIGFSPILCFFNMPKLPSPETIILEAGFIAYTFHDPFQMFPYYFNSHPECKVKDIRTDFLRDIVNQQFPVYHSKYPPYSRFLRDYGALCRKHIPDNLCFILEDKFIHIARSRCDSSFHVEQSILIRDFMKEVIG